MTRRDPKTGRFMKKAVSVKKTQVKASAAKAKKSVKTTKKVASKKVAKTSKK